MGGTGGNLWWASGREDVAAPPFDADAAADLAIVGGGFTGVSAALTAAEAGAKVCLLEADRIGFGGSGRNVGLVNAGLWLPPDQICATLGEGPGRRLIDMLSAAPARVFGLIERHGIDCEPVHHGTLHCAHSGAGLGDLRDRHAQGNRFGAPLQLLDAGETARRTGATGYHGALFDPRAGTIQPYAYCRGLARAAVAAGARIHAESPVTRLGRQGGAWEVEARGHRLRARTVLIATNAYQQGLAGPFRPAYVPVSYSQFATAPLPEGLRTQILAGGEGCWDTALVMTSFRLDRAGRLILGAIGNAEGAAGAVHGSWAARMLRALFPALKGTGFEHVWRGRIAMTADHIPKLVAFGPGALAAFGYSGRGIAPGTTFGAAAAEALLSSDESGLPLPSRPAYAEGFTGAKAAWYETGAALTHLLRPAPFG